MRDAIAQFREAMPARGIIAPDDLIAGGRLHRCDVDGGKRGKGDATYLLHLDGVLAGGFENWRDGLGWQPWKANTGHTFTAEERAAYRLRMETVRRERDTENATRKQEARERAADLIGGPR